MDGLFLLLLLPLLVLWMLPMVDVLLSTDNCGNMLIPKYYNILCVQMNEPFYETSIIYPNYLRLIQLVLL